MIIYVYQKEWWGHVEMVSADKEAIYKKAWQDFKDEYGLDEDIMKNFNHEREAFEEFINNGGVDDWTVTEWEV